MGHKSLDSVNVDRTLDDSVAGEVLGGRYRVDSKIARGGMATVYLAWDTRLDRTVALKVMHPELARHDEFVSRFIREAKTAARLTHPNIVGVFDQSADGGHVYLAMEYVAGCTLRDLLAERGRFTPREALDILGPVLSALGAAHRAGMVHRDVKPENVLIAEEGSYAHAVKVADFGLARSAAAGATISLAGMIVGTASYLAPEQVRSGVCDARSDVYSSGIVLFEMLTGSKPFTGDSPIQVAYRHAHDRVPAPSTLVPGLDPALDALVVRATSQDPEGRPGDANAFHAELIRVFKSLPDAALDFGAVPSPDDPDQVATREMRAVMEQRRPNPTKVMPTTSAEPTRQVLSDTSRTAPVFKPAKPPVKKVVAPRKSPNDPYRLVPADRKWRPSRGHIALVTVLVIALLIGTIAWWYGVGRFRAVPGVVHQPKSAAIAVLGKDGLKASVTEQYDDSVPAGEVIGTSPGPDKHIVRGGTVKLTVSKGPHPIAVPDETGLTQDIATTRLRQAGFGVSVSPSQIYSDTVDSGSVAAQDPPVSAQPGSVITLTISQGQQQFPVPDVTNLTVEQAKAKLHAAGFNTVTVSGLSLVGDTVGSTDPAPGSLARHKDTITLVLKFFS